MELGLVNEGKIMNLSSLKMVEDGIRAGEIPEWLIMEFLFRLPPKIVFRFKLVSKQWLSIILDHSFVNLYCSRALKRQKLQPWTFISDIKQHKYKKLVDIYSGNLKWRPSLYTLSLPGSEYNKEKSYLIYDVRNGFVLYGQDYNTVRDIDESANARICNPVTGQWISLPPHSSYRQNGNRGFLENIKGGVIISSSYQYVNWGFITNIEGGVLISYIVVRMYVSNGKQGKFLTSEVFLSEVGEWNKYNMIIDRVLNTLYNTSCSVVNGVMHWVINQTHELIVYDPHKDPDRVRYISLPGEQRKYLFSICHAHKEQLRYFEVSTSTGDINTFQGYNIWVLNDHNSGDWCLQHRVICAEIQICNAQYLGQQHLSRILPVSFHPYDSDMVYLKCGKSIFLYNIKTRKLEAPKDFCHSVDSWQLRIGIYVQWSKSYLFQIPSWPICLSRSILERQMNR